MTVVILVYGAAIYTYMLPISYHTPEKDMAVSAFHIILTPVLNPLIYSFLKDRSTFNIFSRAPVTSLFLRL